MLRLLLINDRIEFNMFRDLSNSGNVRTWYNGATEPKPRGRDTELRNPDSQREKYSHITDRSK